MNQKTESTHTPGPWRIGDAGNTVFGPPNGSPSPERVATVHGGTRDQVAIDRALIMKANARLIAAAPELLKIARDYLDVIKACVGGEENQTVNEVQNIIFKAEGRI